MPRAHARGRQPGSRRSSGRDRRRPSAAPLHSGHARPAPRPTQQHAVLVRGSSPWWRTQPDTIRTQTRWSPAQPSACGPPMPGSAATATARGPHKAALRHQAWGTPSPSWGSVGPPRDAAVQQRPQAVVGELRKPCPTRLTFLMSRFSASMGRWSSRRWRGRRGSRPPTWPECGRVPRSPSAVSLASRLGPPTSIVGSVCAPPVSVTRRADSNVCRAAESVTHR